MGPKMSKNNHPEFLITLKVLPDNSDPEGYRRLRAFLKSARRAWRLQCTAIQSGGDKQELREMPDSPKDV